MASHPLCWFNRHEPNLDLVRRGDSGYIGHCRHCDAAIQRKGKRVWTRRENTLALQAAAGRFRPAR